MQQADRLVGYPVWGIENEKYLVVVLVAVSVVPELSLPRFQGRAIRSRQHFDIVEGSMHRRGQKGFERCVED